MVGPLTPAPDLDGWAVVERLLKDLESLQDQAWLVIDDVYELRSAEALRQLELLMRAPPELRCVLATRHDMRLGLRLRRVTYRLEEVLADLAAMLFNRVPDRRPAGRLVLPAVNQASSLSSPSPVCQATAGSSWLPVRIQALAVSAGTTVTVTGLRRMPVDIAVRSVCSLG